MHQDGPNAFILRPSDADYERTSSVVIEARYVPVPVELEPRETVNSTLLSLISKPNADCILRSGHYSSGVVKRSSDPRGR